MKENTEVIDRLKTIFEKQDCVSAEDFAHKAEDCYWLYRMAKENPAQLEVAFLRQANILQKRVIDILLDKKMKGEA